MKMVIFYLYLIVKILNILLIEKIKKKIRILMEIYLVLILNIIGTRVMLNWNQTKSKLSFDNPNIEILNTIKKNLIKKFFNS